MFSPKTCRCAQVLWIEHSVIVSRFPPPVMAGHVVQHLAECHAHAVIVVPGSRSYWFPRVQQAAVRSLLISPPNAGGYFQWPCSDGSLKEWKYPRWSMVAYEVDFASCS